MALMPMFCGRDAMLLMQVLKLKLEKMERSFDFVARAVYCGILWRKILIDQRNVRLVEVGRIKSSKILKRHKWPSCKKWKQMCFYEKMTIDLPFVILHTIKILKRRFDQLKVCGATVPLSAQSSLGRVQLLTSQVQASTSHDNGTFGMWHSAINQSWYPPEAGRKKSLPITAKSESASTTVAQSIITQTTPTTCSPRFKITGKHLLIIKHLLHKLESFDLHNGRVVYSGVANDEFLRSTASLSLINFIFVQQMWSLYNH